MNIQKDTCKNYWIINIKENSKKKSQIRFNNSLFKHSNHFDIGDIMCFYKLITHNIMSHSIILGMLKNNKNLIFHNQNKKKEFMTYFYNLVKNIN